MSKRSSLAVPPPSRVEPEPDISHAHKRAIEGALRWAWKELAANKPEVLRKGAEEQITYELASLLNHRPKGRRRAPGLSDFETVIRGESQKASDGRLKKMPDLTFRPPVYRGVTNTSHWGWFVEAKLIGGTATVTKYCQNGVQRFATGEYAARVPSGLMLAYVRDGQQPVAALTPHLPIYNAKDLIPGPTNDTCLSSHPRGALKPNACVVINLFHLWLLVA